MIPARIRSGVEGLDRVLAGGFLEAGLYMIVGPPGAGKTILGSQIAYHHVRNGGRAAFMTLLSETHGRMLAHLRTLDFFDPAAVGSTLQYVGGFRALAAGGMEGLLDLLKRILAEHQATLLVIDGYASLESIAHSDVALKKFLGELQLSLDATGCTGFLLSNDLTTLAAKPALTMADGLIRLDVLYDEMRSWRELTVEKLRGSAHLAGRHLYHITNRGLTIFPRLESVAQPPAEPLLDDVRRPFGLETLDAMLDGGLRGRSATLVIGSAGSGKSALGLQFLAAGLNAGEAALYFGLGKPPPRGAPSLSGLGATGRLTELWSPPGDAMLDVLGDRLLAAVRTHKPVRVVIDALPGFLAAMPRGRTSRYLAALIGELRGLGATTLFLAPLRGILAAEVDPLLDEIMHMLDNVVLLRLVERSGRVRRELGILKSTDGTHDDSLRELTMTSAGIELSGRNQPTG